jgi:hypothetical protein
MCGVSSERSRWHMHNATRMWQGMQGKSRELIPTAMRHQWSINYWHTIPNFQSKYLKAPSKGIHASFLVTSIEINRLLLLKRARKGKLLLKEMKITRIWRYCSVGLLELPTGLEAKSTMHLAWLHGVKGYFQAMQYAPDRHIPVLIHVIVIAGPALCHEEVEPKLYFPPYLRE